MAMALERFAIDGDVFDVLEDCDQLSLGLARLRRQGRITEEDWRSCVEHLTQVQSRIETHLTSQTITAPPIRQRLDP
jgi:hypothetical protein